MFCLSFPDVTCRAGRCYRRSGEQKDKLIYGTPATAVDFILDANNLFLRESMESSDQPVYWCERATMLGDSLARNLAFPAIFNVTVKRALGRINHLMLPGLRQF